MEELLNRSKQPGSKLDKPPSECERLNCSVFDFVCYAALLKHVLKVDVDQVKKLSQAEVEQFRSYLQRAH